MASADRTLIAWLGAFALVHVVVWAWLRLWHTGMYDPNGSLWNPFCAARGGFNDATPWRWRYMRAFDRRMRALLGLTLLDDKAAEDDDAGSTRRSDEADALQFIGESSSSRTYLTFASGFDVLGDAGDAEEDATDYMAVAD